MNFDWLDGELAFGVRWSTALTGVLVLLLVVLATLVVVRRLVARVDSWARGRTSLLDRYFVPFFVRSSTALAVVMAIVIVLPLLQLSEVAATVLKDFTSMVMIGGVAWVLVNALNVTERVVVDRFELKVADNLQARSVYTQVSVLRKIAVVAVVLIALASMLMVFDRVRQLGASILASAGLLSVIVGLSAQRMIGNLLAGIQIALTQPIRIDDAVVVEGEWGWVEELTLTYVVIRIWDERRLVLPINYFNEKPFQNWTRKSAELIGSVYLYVDYRVPVEALREELRRLVADTPLWDERVCSLQVTDLGERTMQLRALVSARNGSDAWDLRCLTRERLIGFVRERYPEALPRFRAVLEQPGTASGLASPREPGARP